MIDTLADWFDRITPEILKPISNMNDMMRKHLKQDEDLKDKRKLYELMKE